MYHILVLVLISEFLTCFYCKVLRDDCPRQSSDKLCSVV